MSAPVTVKTLFYNYTNCYLVSLDKGLLLVDADMPGSLPQFFKEIKRNDIQIQDIRYLLITHYHPDHAGIAQELVDLGIRLIVMEPQRAFLQVPGEIFAKDPHSAFHEINTFDLFVLSCADSRNFLLENGVSGEIIHTPGHSDDSVTLILDQDCAFIGDLPPYTLLSGFEDVKMKESWTKILAHQPRTIYLGHWQPIMLKGGETLAELIA